MEDVPTQPAPSPPQSPTNNIPPTTTHPTNQNPSPPNPTSNTSSPDHHRFEVELEFVQCLASPAYLNFLAQNEYFDSPDFVAYLSYLRYWRKPAYARFIVFPHALYFLHLLQDSSFRNALKRSDYTMLIHQQQGYHWQFGKTMRLRSETVNATPTTHPATAPPPSAHTSAPPPPTNSSPADIAADTTMAKQHMPINSASLHGTAM